MSNSSTSSSKPSRAAMGRAIGFLGGAGLLLVGLYAVGGYGRKDGKVWFQALPRPTNSDTTRYLFIGASQVAASIDTAVFDSVAAQLAGRPILSYNLGMGHSTLHELVFAIQWLRLHNPGILKGSKVFVESWEGMPDYSKWSDAWAFEDSREKLSRYLAVGDLPKFWSQSSLTFPTRVMVGLEVTTGIRNNFWRLRLVAMDRLHALLGRVAPAASDAGGARAALPRPQLSSRGGIISDPEAVERVRSGTVASVPTVIAAQKPHSDWDQTVFRDLVDVVQAAGAELVVFQIPVCSHLSKIFTSPMRQNDRFAFNAFREARKLDYVPFETIYPDSVYPDAWHMTIPVSQEYSRLLAERIFTSKQ